MTSIISKLLDKILDSHASFFFFSLSYMFIGDYILKN